MQQLSYEEAPPYFDYTPALRLYSDVFHGTGTTQRLFCMAATVSAISNFHPLAARCET
jgi:hypothetical protein